MAENNISQIEAVKISKAASLNAIELIKDRIHDYLIVEAHVDYVILEDIMPQLEAHIGDNLSLWITIGTGICLKSAFWPENIVISLFKTLGITILPIWKNASEKN